MKENSFKKFLKRAGLVTGVAGVVVSGTEGKSVNEKPIDIDNGRIKTEIEKNKITIIPGSKEDIKSFHGIMPSYEGDKLDLGEEKYEGPPMLDDDFSFEQQDTIPDNSLIYGYKFLGKRKMLAGTIEVGYYGTDKTKTLVKAPYRAERKNEKLYKLGDLYPNMGNFALFGNCDPGGNVHFVELPRNIDVFLDKDGNVFASVCGNRLMPLVFEITNSNPQKLIEKKEEVNKTKKEDKKCEPCKDGIKYRHHCVHGTIITETPEPPCRICFPSIRKKGGQTTSGGYITRG